MEVNMPKNRRLIGEEPKQVIVLLEDYVSTYLRGELGEEAAILVGKSIESQEEVRIVVSGAIACPALSWAKEQLGISIKTWNYIYQELKRFFSGQEIVGWYIPITPNTPSNYMDQINRLQITDFSRDDMVFATLKAKGTDPSFYIQQENTMLKLEGYYIYYEKNDSMREYIMLKKEEKQLEEDLRAEQLETDRVVMRYRDYINSEQTKVMRSKAIKSEKINNTLAYVMCVTALIFMFVLSIGIVAGYQQVNAVDEAMAQLGEELNVDQKKDSTEQEASGYYEVKQGDSLASISMEIYNNEDMVEEICRINQITDPEAIYVGQKLLLP